MIRQLPTMKKFVRLMLVFCCLSMCAKAQSSGSNTASRKDVPVIRVTPNRSSDRVTRIALRTAGFSASNITAEKLLRFAYGTKSYALVGIPDWFATERFDVDVTESGADSSSAGPINIQEHRKLLARTVLANAFQLKFHTERTSIAGYALTVDSTGARIATHDPLAWAPGRIENNNGRIEMTALPISSFADELSDAIGGPVLDHTGLKENYDLSLSWTPTQDACQRRAALVSAVRERLGLNLVPGPQNVEKFVIDGINLPR